MKSIQRWRKAASGALFYMLLGPLIGSLSLVLAAIAATLVVDLDTDTALSYLIGSPIIIFFGYILGALPAAITGLLAGWHHQRITHWTHAVAIGLIGMASTAALFCLLFLVFEQPRVATTLQALRGTIGIVLASIPGFVAGMCCALLQLRSERNAWKAT